MMPIYLSGRFKIYLPAQQLRSSADQTILTVPNEKLKTLFHLGPGSWNNRSQKVREASSTDISKMC